MSAAGADSAVTDVARYADMFAAIGTEARLRILRLLLSAHPRGLVYAECCTRSRAVSPKAVVWAGRR